MNVWGLKFAGAGATRGAIDVFAIGLAAGALRLVTAREGPFCIVALITCAEALWMLAKSAAIKQSAENLYSFINFSGY